MKIIVITLYICSLSSAMGQSIQSFPFVRDSAVVFKNRSYLSLDEVLAVVNEYHPKLTSARLGIKNAQAVVQRAWGTLDPQLQSSLTAKREFDKFKQQSADITTTIPLYWGQKIVAGWKRTLGLFDEDKNTSLSGESAVGISIPLWRNILIDKNRATILKAETSPESAEAELVAIRNEIFVKSAEKYWEWSAAFFKFKIATELLDIILFRSRATREEIIRGERAPIDSVEIYQEIQRRTGLKIKARREYEKSAIALSVFLWDKNEMPAELPLNVIPPNLPPALMITPAQYESDRISALSRRPELRSNNVEKQLASVDIDIANEQWKPDVSFKFSPFSSSISSDYPSRLDYKIGLDISLPILQRDARGQMAQAEIKQTNISLKRILIERDIVAEIEDAASELFAGYEQYNAARSERESADALEIAERQLFSRGESSLLTVNFRERFSAEAAAREVDALSSFHRAIARYRWATAQF